MRAALLLLLLAGCSRGGAESCSDLEPCDQGGAPMSVEERDLRPPERPDLAAPADMLCDVAGGWQVCSGVCVSPLGSDAHCGACGKACGTSDMGAALRCCNLSCVDQKTSTNHCGRCFNVCGGAAPWCCNGSCSSQRC